MNTTNGITDEPFEVFDFGTVSLEEFKPAQYRLEDATLIGNYGIQMEVDTQDFQDEVELSVLDDRSIEML